jgi:hypothetical protein
VCRRTAVDAADFAAAEVSGIAERLQIFEAANCDTTGLTGVCSHARKRLNASLTQCSKRRRYSIIPSVSASQVGGVGY